MNYYDDYHASFESHLSIRLPWAIDLFYSFARHETVQLSLVVVCKQSINKYSITKDPLHSMFLLFSDCRTFIDRSSIKIRSPAAMTHWNPRPFVKADLKMKREYNFLFCLLLIFFQLQKHWMRSCFYGRNRPQSGIAFLFIYFIFNTWFGFVLVVSCNFYTKQIIRLLSANSRFFFLLDHYHLRG